MFNAATGAECRTVAIAASRQNGSIRLTISEEMKCGMGAVTEAGADARGCSFRHDNRHTGTCGSDPRAWGRGRIHSLLARLQRTRDRFGDIAANKRFAEHVDDPYGLREFAQLRTAVSAHEYD